MRKYRVFWEDAARRKIGAGEAWQAARATFDANGYHVAGSLTTPKLRGPRAGQLKWAKPFDKVTVTHAEERAERERYRRETGNCDACCGSGEVLARYSADDGAHYRPCAICGGSGRAGAQEVAK